MNKDDQIVKALDTIDAAQQSIWYLHHAIKQYSEPLAMKFWEQSLQIEHALLELNEALFNKREYWSERKGDA